MSALLIGAAADGGAPQQLALAFANRHGLIAGATGTGKTVTLQVLAEAFAVAGTCVFMADVKGDLTGLAQPAGDNPKLAKRAARTGVVDYAPAARPVTRWDVFAQQGLPLRATITELGPLLLSQLLELNETQEGVLNVVFRVADDDGLLLLDLKDLRALLSAVSARAGEISAQYGRVAPSSIAAIQRRLLVLENQGAEAFFGEPALALEDLTAPAPDGSGMIHILAADRLMRSPRLYATVLLWLLSELFEELPEVGDRDRPVLALFFDEAHLLFDRAPRALVDKVEQAVRLIRSKGVGVYFVTQSPDDLPDAVLGQLGARVQHALRGYTPRQVKAIRAAAATMRPNPAFDAATILPQLAVGEALVSTLDATGAPTVVQRTLIRPPASRIGPADAAVLARLDTSPLAARYGQTIDRESAYEVLQARAERAAPEAAAPERFSSGRRYSPRAHPERAPPPKRRRRGDSVSEAFMKSMARAAGSRAGRSLIRGVLGGLFRGR